MGPPVPTTSSGPAGVAWSLEPSVSVAATASCSTGGGSGGTVNWQMLLLGLASLIALILDAPAPIVLLVAGILGVFIF